MIYFYIILVIAVLFLLFKRASLGRAYSIEQIGRGIEDLVNRGFEDGFLVIELKGRKEFLQFQKQIETNGTWALECVLPCASWSQPYYGLVVNLADERGLQAHEIKNNDSNEVAKFLFIDFSKNVKSAQDFATSVFKDIYKVDEGQKYFIKLENSAP